MKRPNLWRALALALAVSLSCGCGKGHWEDQEKVIGYKGEARRNPFLAAQRLLDQVGYYADSVNSLERMPESYDTMLVPHEAVYSDGRARYFLEWVASGGHLVFALDGGNHLHNDWSEEAIDFSDVFSAGDRLESPILGALGLSTNDRREETLLTYDGLKVEFPGITGLQSAEPLEGALFAGDPHAAAMISLPHGEGRVTVLVDAQCLRNRYLGDHDHGDFLIALANERDYGTFWFVLGGRLSFLALLMERAWMPVLCLALLVLFWLWKNLPRFGPFRAPLEVHSRKFVEHVDMAGRFLWRRRNTSELLAPLRRRVIHAFSRSLGLHPDTPPEEIAHRIAQSTGMDENRVRFALTARTIRDATHLTQTVRDLQKLQSIRS